MSRPYCVMALAGSSAFVEDGAIAAAASRTANGRTTRRLERDRVDGSSSPRDRFRDIFLIHCSRLPLSAASKIDGRRLGAPGGTGAVSANERRPSGAWRFG